MSSTLLLLLRQCIKGRDRTLVGIDYVNNSHAGAGELDGEGANIFETHLKLQESARAKM